MPPTTEPATRGGRCAHRHGEGEPGPAGAVQGGRHAPRRDGRRRKGQEPRHRAAPADHAAREPHQIAAPSAPWVKQDVRGNLLRDLMRLGPRAPPSVLSPAPAPGRCAGCPHRWPRSRTGFAGAAGRRRVFPRPAGRDSASIENGRSGSGKRTDRPARPACPRRLPRRPSRRPPAAAEVDAADYAHASPGAADRQRVCPGTVGPNSERSGVGERRTNRLACPGRHAPGGYRGSGPSGPTSMPPATLMRSSRLAAGQLRQLRGGRGPAGESMVRACPRRTDRARRPVAPG